MEQMKKSFDQQMAQMKIESEERIKHAELLAKDQLAKLDAEVKILIEQMKGGQSESLERVRGSISQDTERVKADVKDKSETRKEIGSTVLDRLEGSVKQIQSDSEQKLRAVFDELNAPKEVVRGKDGRVEGVKVGNKVRKAVRDADGRITALQ
jgi:phage-related minor tail protein